LSLKKKGGIAAVVFICLYSARVSAYARAFIPSIALQHHQEKIVICCCCCGCCRRQRGRKASCAKLISLRSSPAAVGDAAELVNSCTCSCKQCEHVGAPAPADTKTKAEKSLRRYAICHLQARALINQGMLLLNFWFAFSLCFGSQSNGLIYIDGMYDCADDLFSGEKGIFKAGGNREGEFLRPVEGKYSCLSLLIHPSLGKEARVFAK
jgi:hypothetical protein